MKFNVEIKMNLQPDVVIEKVAHAAHEGLKDIVVDVTGDVKRDSPKLTGHNRRSIEFEVKGLEGEVFSTSGYGGYLEVGTARMRARPYFKPAADRHVPRLPDAIKRHL